MPTSPVSTALDLVDDPQLIDRGFLNETDHPIFGRIPTPRGALGSLRGTDLAPAPTLGQDNGDLLG